MTTLAYAAIAIPWVLLALVVAYVITRPDPLDRSSRALDEEIPPPSDMVDFTGYMPDRRGARGANQ